MQLENAPQKTSRWHVGRYL